VETKLKFTEKIMVAEEVFVNPKRVEHASIYIKIVVLRSKKVLYKVSYLRLPGAAVRNILH
jgi:hypothetical protein